MKSNTDPNVVREKALELAFAARTVIEQLTLRDCTPAGKEARDILLHALDDAIPNKTEELAAA